MNLPSTTPPSTIDWNQNLVALLRLQFNRLKLRTIEGPL